MTLKLTQYYLDEIAGILEELDRVYKELMQPSCCPKHFDEQLVWAQRCCTQIRMNAQGVAEIHTKDHIDRCIQIVAQTQLLSALAADLMVAIVERRMPETAARQVRNQVAECLMSLWRITNHSAISETL